ncbi:MAG: tRNA dihydrouridine synthase DusB [Acidimicrobiales bacterium]|nr:tRNA dihydrouridine synthase DusB [Acidimicrobiales bacterium]
MDDPDPTRRSALNRDVPLAAPGEFAPLRVGEHAIWPPVVLAPMAGVTDVPFRTLCREFGAGLYVNQMITARGYVERHAKTLKLAEFGADEHPRSIQLYGTDPRWLTEATRRLVDEGHVDHIDMNFGCPVPKVTRHGGGAALPVKRRLFTRIVSSVVAAAAGRVPVTVKFRIGVDDDHLTFLDAGRIAAAEGVAAVALHARTAEQLYSGEARWAAIGELKAAVTDVPVLGNGDIWEAHDALRMMRLTGCDGVVVGRGCLGRPRLFGDLVRVFDGREIDPPPTLGQTAATMRRHAELLVEWMGTEDALRAFRKHALWYLTGFPVGGEARRRLHQVATMSELDDVLAGFDTEVALPVEATRFARSHSGGPKPVALPAGWLDDPDADVALDARAEALVSGG